MIKRYKFTTNQITSTLLNIYLYSLNIKSPTMKVRTVISKALMLSMLLFSVSYIPISAQNDGISFWNHVRFGGGLGLSFGDGYFSGTIAPISIYEFNPQIAAGLGLNGTYRSEKDFYKSVILGGSVLALFNVIPEIQLSAEFEELNESRTYDKGINFVRAPETNFWYTALFVGAGFRSQLVTIGLRYDLLYKEDKSIYGTAWMPFVRVFF